MIIDDNYVKEALQRIARTPDGQIFHIGLQRALMALSPSPESGALQTFEGGRRFAQQIKAVMDEAIAGEPVDGQSERERPIVIVARSAVPVGGTRGARRRGAGVSTDQSES